MLSAVYFTPVVGLMKSNGFAVAALAAPANNIAEAIEAAITDFLTKAFI
jgi:hypothetical protein